MSPARAIPDDAHADGPRRTRLSEVGAAALRVMTILIVGLSALVATSGLLDWVRRVIAGLPVDWTRVALSVILITLVVYVGVGMGATRAPKATDKSSAARRSAVWQLVALAVLVALMATPDTARWFGEMQLSASLTMLLEYVKALAWPIVALIAILLFKEPLGDLILRIESGKGVGMELKFRSTDDVALLARQKSEQALDTTDTPQEDSASSEEESQERTVSVEQAFFQMVASLNILEHRTETLIARLEIPIQSRGRRSPGIRPLFDALRGARIIPASAQEALNAALEVRNRAVHRIGVGDQPSVGAMADAIDSIENLSRMIESSMVRTHI